MISLRVNNILTDLYEKVLVNGITEHLDYPLDEQLSPGEVEKLLKELRATGVFISIEKIGQHRIACKIDKEALEEFFSDRR